MRGLARLDDEGAVRDSARRQRLDESIVCGIPADQRRIVRFVRLAVGPGPGRARKPSGGYHPRHLSLERVAKAEPFSSSARSSRGVWDLDPDGQWETAIAMAASPRRPSP